MSSIIKVNTYQDANGNALFSSDGSGNVTMSANGAKNTPSFFANKTSNQNITDNTYTKITFDTEVYDTDNAFDLANDKFTVPSGKGGKYSIGAVLFSDSNAVSNYEYGDIKFYLNGSAISQYIVDVRNNAGNQITLSSQIIFDLSASDYIEVYCRINDLSGTPTVNGGSSTYISYFYGYRLIGA